jgi:hypothetical protein
VCRSGARSPPGGVVVWADQGPASGAVSPGAAVAELLTQREDDRADGERVAASRGNGVDQLTKNRGQHAAVIGAGAGPGVAPPHSAASVSPVASATTACGTRSRPCRSPQCRPCSPSGSPPASRRCRRSPGSRCWSRSSGAALGANGGHRLPEIIGHRGADAPERAVGGRGRQHRPEQPLPGPQVLNVGARLAAPPASASPGPAPYPVV